MADQLNDTLLIAEQWQAQGRALALATVIDTWGSAPRPVGSHLIIDSEGNFEGSVSGGCVEGAVVFEAVEAIDPQQRFQHVLNLQGDLPEMPADIPHQLAATLEHRDCELATLVTPASADETARPQIVKAVISWKANGFGDALYFSRAAVPTGTAETYHHIGVYGWRRSALARFVSLPPSPLELAEKLEQLRALEAGMRIGVAKIAAAPGGVDTAEDLQAVRQRLAAAPDN